MSSIVSNGAASILSFVDVILHKSTMLKNNKKQI